MKRNIIWIIMLVLAVMVGSTSCGKRQHIKLSKDTLTFSSPGGVGIIEIKADCDWVVDKDPSQDWYSVSPTEGSNDTILVVRVSPNASDFDRNGILSVVSANGRTNRKITINQTKIIITEIVRKVWFTRFYERWNTDYYNQNIVESYTSEEYYANPQYVNWFFYFLEDYTGYQIRTYREDTIYYPYDYVYYPDGDSLYICFHTVDDSIEDYHATVEELNQDRFVISDEFRPHQFEKIYTVNVSHRKGEFKINPKKIAKKPAGPLIQVGN